MDLSEPFKLIPKEKWTALRDFNRTDWPANVTSTCLIDNQIANPGLNEVCDIQIYCPDGKMGSGLLATIKYTGKVSYRIMIHSRSSENTEDLENALLKTTLIDWNQGPNISAANAKVIEVLRKIEKPLGIEMYSGDEFKAIVHVLEKNTRVFDLNYPPNTTVGPIKQQHIDLVDKTWTFHSETSRKYFEVLNEHDQAFVLYSENYPLCWVSIDESGAFTHLFTQEKHRKKGYAEFLTKYASNYLLNQGRDVLAYTLIHNTNPQNLLNKLGFQIVGAEYWPKVKKLK